MRQPLAVILLALALPPALRAQAAIIAPPAIAPGLEACDGRPVTEIYIRTLPPYPNGILRRWRALSNFIQDIHVTTRTEVIRRFLTFEASEGCRPIDLSESERILRAQPFIADARVTAQDDGAGGVRVEITTRDEVSWQIGGGVKAPAKIRGLSLGNSNIEGGAIQGLIRWQEGDVYRDLYGARIMDHQLFNRRLQADIEGTRGRIGGDWLALVGQPFLTDLQRVAWRATVGESRLYYSFLRPGELSPAIGVDWSFRDLGGVFRIGEPGRLSLFGASLTREESHPDTDAVFVTAEGILPTSAPPIERYRGQRSARVNALWGVRNIRFIRARGMDALDGVQDMRRGFQLGVVAGRSLNVLGSRDDDIFLATDLYGGAGTNDVFAAFQVLGEGRQDYNENNWDDILATGRAALYVKPSPVHTVISSIEYSSGWRQLVPFQLGLGDFEAGVRGYRNAPYGGAQRVVGRIEERWFWGRPWGAADGGLAIFSDVGKLWAGDAPYGIDTGWRMSLGLGLLAGIPPRSKRLWRVDFAYPIAEGSPSKFEIRIANRDYSRVFWREPPDVRRSRGRTLPTSVFNWP